MAAQQDPPTPSPDPPTPPPPPAHDAPPRHDAPPALTPTAKVILGMVALGRQTGYDIKQLVDKSTRHFWAASYGQIYPELRRLEDKGLIRGQSEPTGGRARTIYTLTPDGMSALIQWLETDNEVPFEVRAEGMLKLFFSDVTPPEHRIRVLRAMRDSHRRTLAQLEALEAGSPQMPTGPHLTLELGIELHTTIVKWCDDAERRMTPEGNRDVD